jgi:hypothetical protein
MRVFLLIGLFLAVQAFGQDVDFNRGSIPEELMRPKKGEVIRYPVDTVIGELGQGSTSDEAYSFAKSVAMGLLSGRMEHPGIATVSSVLRESYLSVLETVEPRNYRLGGGREETDGAVSYLVRFIGKEYGITGELFIRLVRKRTERKKEAADAETEAVVEYVTTTNWVFEELILEEVKSWDVEQKETLHRFDFSPYERFF